MSKDCLLRSKPGKLLSLSDREFLTCFSCHLILRDPFQVNSCGHRYCETCLDKIMQSSEARCLEDEELIQRSEVRRDKGCKKEIDALMVACSGKARGCDWKGFLKGFEQHAETCTRILRPCKYGCGVKLTNEALPYHEENQCTERSVTCELCNLLMQYRELTDHLQTCGCRRPECRQTISIGERKEHESICSEGLQQCCIPGCGFKSSSIVMNQHISEKHSLQLVDVIAELQDKIKRKHFKLEIQREKLEALELKFDVLMRTVGCGSASSAKLDSENSEPDLRYDVDDLFSPSNAKSATIQSIKPRVSALDDSVIKLVPFVDRLNLALHYESPRLAECLEGAKAAKQTTTSHAEELEKLKRRHDLLDARTTNGVFIWKISDVDRHHSNAVLNRSLTLYSPPFLTSPHGYRLCLKAYMNGYGPGWGTHISVLCVLMRTEHDNILPWPFQHQITLTMINQDAHPSKSISGRLTPSPGSVAFLQPTTEMNVASGFPRFASQSVLSNVSFTKGDVIFHQVSSENKRPVKMTKFRAAYIKVDRIAFCTLI